MNANCYKTVISKRLGALVAVGEHAASQGKATGSCTGSFAGAGFVKGIADAGVYYIGALTLSFALVTMAYAAPANNALPTGGQVAQGAAAISQSGANMGIYQSTARAVVNWQSFDIGKDAKVNIVQPNAQAVLLNRVNGPAPSQIFGQMTANGQVVLVNPNGVTFGKDGSVSAAGLTASTLNTTDADFMAGRNRFTRDGATGQVINQGTLTSAPGGYVALLGASVSNEGKIVAPQGNVALGAAETITLPVYGSRRIKMELTPSAINAAVANQKGGSIVTEGGQVYMQAAAVGSAMASVMQSGGIDTSGAQGGAVHLLADGGHIRVDGSIKANSTQGTAGGDLYIGRDKDTNVLAAVGDVSGARLESKGGFVETSGQYLVTTGTRVLAKDWLLDPYNITIAPSGPSGTAYSSTYNPGADSVILASDIAANLNSGTSVNIQTGLAGSPGLSDGNIVVNAAIVKSGSSDASLTLTANNGITVNQRIGRAATDATSSGKLNVVMTANGDATSTSNSQGIALNNVIDANGGQVTLSGTSKNTSGVQLGPTYVYGVNNNSRSGVVFNGGSGITADNYQVTGTHTVAAGNSFGVSGVYLDGSVNFKATGNTDSNITGNSNAQGNFGPGVMVMDNATIRLDNQGTGVTTLKGSNTNTGGGNGVRIGAGTNSAVINAIGRVTLGQQSANLNAPIFVRGTINASQNSASQSGLSILGQTGLNTSAVQIWDTTINATGIDVVVDGITANAAGVYIQNAVNTTWTTKNLTVIGVANTTAGSSGTGVQVQRYSNVLTVNASGNIAVQGTVQGTGTGSGLYFAQSGWGAQAPRMTAGGNITLRGNNRASETNGTEAVYIGSGVQATAGGNIVLQGETNNAAVNAINFYSAATSFTAWNTVGASALQGNTTLQATGNVLVQSNQGGIYLTNQLSSTLNNGGTPLLTSDTKITGKNITFDNTGAGMTTGASNTVGSGSIDATTGAITAGSGKATGTRTTDINPASLANAHGVNFGDNRDIKATGNLHIMGASTAGDGVRSIAKMEAGESLTIAGQTQSAAQRAVVITNNGALNGILKVTDGKTINIHANTLTLGGAATAVDAGTTSTVNIKTLTSGNEIVISAADTPSTTLASQKLGIDQSELNRINAGHLVIGDTASTGKITVSGATTTAATTGNITLQTGGNIEVNAALTVGDDPGTTATVEASKTLTLNAAGANSAVSQTATAAIKATGLELLGTNATHTLTNVNNQVATLAVNSKAINYVNSSALTLGVVNATTGINATGDVSIATQTGNLTISENVNTTASSATALVLNAGKSSGVGAAVGADVGGNIVVGSGKTVGVDSGGVAQLMTGSITGDTSAAGLAAAGKFRYNSDESSTNYNTALSSGVNVIYREKPTVTVNVNSVSKTYDGITFTGGNGFTEVTPSGLKNGDALTGATATAIFGGTAQNAKNASSTPYTLSASESNAGKSALGYGVTYNSGTLTVAKKDVTLTSITAANKTYDGNTNATITAGTFGGTVGTETLVISGSGSFDTKNAGSNKTVTVSDVTSLTKANGTNGGDWDNYNLTTTGIKTTTANIAKKDVTLTSITAANKTYDGNTNATITAGTFGGTVGTETLVISGSGSFDTKNAGTGKTVTVSDVTSLTKANGTGDWDNYNLTTTGSKTTTANIAKKDVTLDSLTAANKTYDGNTNATITAGAISGTVGTETLVISGSGTFHTKNAGTGKTVTVSDVISLTKANGTNGGDWDNYNLTTTGIKTTTANIAKKDVTLDSLTAANKTYDANTNATITAGTFGGTVGTETLAVSGSGSFDTKNAGTGKTVTVSDVISLTKANGTNGGDWNNYNLTTTSKTTTANIAKATLTVTLADQTKTYDGTTAATLVPTAFTVKGVTVAGQTETASVNQTVALYNDKNVLGASSVTANLAAGNFAAATGTDLNNYNLPTSVTGKGAITPKDAAVTGTATTVQANGTQQTQLPATKSGFVAGEDVTVSGLATGLIAGTYNSNLNAAPANAATLLSNYKIAYTNAPLQITPAVVTNNTVTVALARPTTPTSRLNFSGFSNAGGVGAAVAGAVDSGADSREPLGATALPPQACSPESLQECDCEERGDDNIELCLVPGARI
ncbi:YDG domain-containing protein [Limnohabitans sp. DM1]|uniref:YDG domain-containing protein n=1 Tax=Limnohabitans sp. DM1 TaxID=1597955 RepID=UPI000AA56CF3|nr:YDG domain-containing protein [Limnohabitans sp. DM1]